MSGPEQVLDDATEPGDDVPASQRFPARPRQLRPRGRLARAVPDPDHGGEPTGANPHYVRWLVDQSMLHDASVIAEQFSGVGSMWQNPFGEPDPRAAVETAGVWFSAYPISMVTPPGVSYLAALGEESLWAAFEQIGIQGVHTGPVKVSGGLRGWTATPSVDGHFDRISTRIDPTFGTEDEFRAMAETAARHDGIVIDDIVPGHTGKGSDFRLAEMKVGDYPGIYHMVQVPADDWHLLPEVPAGRDSVNLDPATERRLEQAGYIVGPLQRVIFAEPGVKDTNWSATAEVLGVDGLVRRWVYLHYFKEGQPSINWLDPTFAGIRLVIGDALHSLGDLGAGALRLDANGFLGVEKSLAGAPAWSEGHPLSEAANQMVASMVRKVGGFTFQELNLAIDDIADTSANGADLSYDFVNRPACHHALATADTEFLRLTLRASMAHGVQPVQLVHALQNHDELTYELVHFATRHREDQFTYRGTEVTGRDLATAVREDLVAALTGEAAPYNAVFTTNGIASTSATVVAASLGYRDLTELTREQVHDITRAHLLLAMANAWQPGVFALSGWDLCGSLTLERAEVADLLVDGDTRWIHRSAYDLMGFDPSATRSASGMPRGRSLYGTLPDQLGDPHSFASRLREILAVRRRYGLATATALDVPDVPHPSMLVLVHGLEGGDLQVTSLNFATEPVEGHVRSEFLPAGSRVVDAAHGADLGEVDSLGGITLSLAGHSGRFLVVHPPEGS